MTTRKKTTAKKDQAPKQDQATESAQPPKDEEISKFPTLQAAREAALAGKPVPFFIYVETISESDEFPAIVDGNGEILKVLHGLDEKMRLDLTKMANAALRKGLGQGRAEVRSSMMAALGMMPGQDGAIDIRLDAPVGQRRPPAKMPQA